MTGRLLTQADMARRLNITLDHFRRHWRGWVQAGALCPPARSPGQPRWNPAAVEAFERGLPTPGAAAPDAPCGGGDAGAVPRPAGDHGGAGVTSPDAGAAASSATDAEALPDDLDARAEILARRFA